MSNIDYDNLIICCFNKTINEEWPNNIHERTFVSRMAHYLTNEIEGENDNLKVDVEYNRHFNDIKKVNNSNRFVDLIIHKRNSDEFNDVAIEFKKENNSTEDKKKLIDLQNELGYKYIYYICINEKKIEKYENDDWKPLGGNKYE